MKRVTVAIFAFACLLGAPAWLVAQLNTTPKNQMSHGELKKLEVEARTPAQFRMLADYYRQKAREFSAKAAEEKVEWDRRSQNVTGPSAKSPRPVDSARNLYEYYQYESDHAAKLADQYEKNVDGQSARM